MIPDGPTDEETQRPAEIPTGAGLLSSVYMQGLRAFQFNVRYFITV